MGVQRVGHDWVTFFILFERHFLCIRHLAEEWGPKGGFGDSGSHRMMSFGKRVGAEMRPQYQWAWGKSMWWNQGVRKDVRSWPCSYKKGLPSTGEFHGEDTEILSRCCAENVRGTSSTLDWDWHGWLLRPERKEAESPNLKGDGGGWEERWTEKNNLK